MCVIYQEEEQEHAVSVLWNWNTWTLVLYLVTMEPFLIEGVCVCTHPSLCSLQCGSSSPAESALTPESCSSLSLSSTSLSSDWGERRTEARTSQQPSVRSHQPSLWRNPTHTHTSTCTHTYTFKFTSDCDTVYLDSWCIQYVISYLPMHPWDVPRQLLSFIKQQK